MYVFERSVSCKHSPQVTASMARVWALCFRLLQDVFSLLLACLCVFFSVNVLSVYDFGHMHFFGYAILQ